MPQPLPSNPYATGTPIHQAYVTCLALEAGLALANWSTPPTLVCARLLGYMIIYSPTDDGRANITHEINSCNGNEVALHSLAKFYVDYYLRPCSQAKQRSHSYVLRSCFQTIDDLPKHLLEEPPKSYKEAKKAALRRDGYRCMITGFVDFETASAFPNEFATLSATHGVRVTSCAHIFAPSTRQDDISGDNTDGPKHNYVTVMMRMGDVPVPDGEKIHRLENVMTMEIGVHGLFDALALWLEATGVINQYTLCANGPGILNNLPATITFNARDNLPLPDPRYLALHAACAKVAHLSGAGEYIDIVDRDISTTLVLAEDGSSARVLAEAMNRISITA